MAKLGYQQAQQKQFARQAEKLRKLRERYSIPVDSLAGWAQSDRDIERNQPKTRYGAYLASEHWQQFRLNLLATYGTTCDGCKRSGLRVQVHHRHYNSVGHEQRQDVEVLCRDCHTKRHNLSGSSVEHPVRKFPMVMPREQKHLVKRKSRTAGRGR